VPYDRTRSTSSSPADWPTLLHDVVHVTPRWQPQKAASESPNRSLSKRASLLGWDGGPSASSSRAGLACPSPSI
jgi:hypothetical protein